MAANNPIAVELKREYAQWKFSCNLLKYLTQRTRDYKPIAHPNMQKRIKIQFGRWLMAVQFFSSEQLELDQRYPLFPKQPLNANQSRKELERNLLKSFEMSPDQAENLVDEVHNMLDKFLNNDAVVVGQRDAPCATLSENSTSGQIMVEEFRTRHCPRVKYLVRRYGLENTALLCLRYDHLKLYRGGESGLSVTALNAMHDIGRATRVGFASPLNCRLLGRPGVTFCSLFPELSGAAFGGLGDFFRVKLEDHPGGWIVDPPFLPAIMDAAARKVEAALRESEPGSLWFFVTFPNWDDSEAWQMLDASQWKVSRIDPERKSFVQQGCYGECYRADVDISVFVLGQLPDDVDLIEMRNLISIDDQDEVERDWQDACERLASD